VHDWLTSRSQIKKPVVEIVPGLCTRVAYSPVSGPITQILGGVPMPRDESVNGTVFERVRWLLSARKSALRTLELAYRDKTVSAEEYLSCFRSLVWGIGELQAILGSDPSGRNSTMPPEYVIDADRRITLTFFAGIITRQEVSAHIANLSADPDFSPDLSELAVLAKGTELQLSLADVQYWVDEDAFLATSKRAFAVPTHEAAYGVIRMYQALRGDSPIVKIFETVSEALAWLSASRGVSARSSCD
jgi:hypothetical protein